jgi:uncharacterized delta-60 repeat protein
MYRKVAGVFLLLSFSSLSFAFIELAPNFGTNQGVTRTVIDPSGNTENEAYAVALYDNGEIVVAGLQATKKGIDIHLVLVKYDVNGLLDTSFGQDGLVISNVKIPDSWPVALLIQNNEKILVAGIDESKQALLARYNFDGTLDMSFGVEGVASLSAVAASSEVTQILELADGNIIVVGEYDDDVEGAFLVRLTPNGIIDPSFADAGIRRDLFMARYSDALDVVELDNGRLMVLAEAAGNDRRSNALLVRYTSDGLIDVSFADSGIQTVSFYTGEHDIEPFSLRQQKDGKLLIVVYFETSSELLGAVARLLPNGELDMSFANNGVFLTSELGEYSIYDAIELNDGSYLVFGNIILPGKLELSAFILTQDGNINVNIGTNGLVTFPERVGEVGGYGRIAFENGSYFLAGRIEDDFNLIKIISPEPSVISFEQSNITISESSNELTVSIVRNGDTQNIASVDYSTVEGTAKETSDYIVDSGTITFNQGESSKTISLTIIDDVVTESEETFSISLSSPYQSTIGEYNNIEVSIQDNDSEPEPEDTSSGGGSVTWMALTIGLIIGWRKRYLIGAYSI